MCEPFSLPIIPILPTVTELVLVAADDAAVDVVGPPAAVGLGAHDRGELVPEKCIHPFYH